MKVYTEFTVRIVETKENYQGAFIEVCLALHEAGNWRRLYGGEINK